MQIEFTII